MIQVLFDSVWIDIIKAYGQSKNWIPDIFTNSANIFGGILFRKNTNGSHNESTYRADGYIKLSSKSDNLGEATIYTQNKIPLNTYNSVTVKFRQISTKLSYDYCKFIIKMRETNISASMTDGLVLYTTNQYGDTGVMELTLDLTQYNIESSERYFCMGIIGNAEIYSVTFNK